MLSPRRILTWAPLAAAVLAACAEGSAGVGSDREEEEEEVGGAGGGPGAGGFGQGGGGAAAPASSGSGPNGPSAASSVASSNSSGPSSSSSSSSSSVASSSSSGGLGCDSELTCEDCQSCAFVTPSDCQAEADACILNQDCLDLNDCLNLCAPSDTLCINDCANAYPNGIDDLIALGDCIFCDACYVTCDGATNC